MLWERSKTIFIEPGKSRGTDCFPLAYGGPPLHGCISLNNWPVNDGSVYKTDYIVVIDTFIFVNHAIETDWYLKPLEFSEQRVVVSD